ncbi:MAG TPA: MFS transporter [Acetobacteraceae bacterium]|nr:MFS transporter [Acetobacteraceae bacterium]
MAAPSKAVRLKSAQRYGLLLLCIIGVLNYMDRGTLSVANPLIRHDLGVSIAEMGVLLSAFLWPYAFFLLPSGGLVDRFGPRRVLCASLVVWSIAQAAAGFVANLGQFIVARAALGVGEAPTFPAFARMVRDWYHSRDQASAVGVWNASPALGTAIAPPLLTGLMLGFGWRWMFVLMGFAGMVLAGVWFALFRDRSECLLSETDAEALTAGEQSTESLPTSIAAWGRLFSFRATWGLVLGFFGNVYIGWMFIAWLPGYLEMQRHMSIPKTGLVASVPYFCGVVGSIAGGLLASRLLKGGMSAINSRKFPTVAGTVLMGLATLVAAETPSNTIAVIAISFTMFFGFFASGTSWSLATACAPPQYAASLGAIMDFGGFIGGALAPMVTGFVVQATGTFAPALVVAGLIGLVSASLYQLLIPDRAIHVNELHIAAVEQPLMPG